jgi:hypothetical protein
VRFLLIKRLDNFSLKLLFQVEMTKKDLTIVILLFFFFFQMHSQLKIIIIIIIIIKVIIHLKKCFLDNNDTSQFYFRVIITKPLTFAGCIGNILLLVHYQLCSIRYLEQSGHYCTEGFFGLIKKMKYFGTN